MAWQEIRDPATNHLLARINPERNLLELQRKKSTYLVDLERYLHEPYGSVTNVLLTVTNTNGTQPVVESQEPPQASE